MNIEALVRWPDIEVKDQAEARLKKLLDGEEAQLSLTYSYSPMVFEIKEVCRFNKANDPEHTTLRFYDSSIHVIKFSYEDFKQLFIETTGNTILSLLPEEEVKEDKPKKRKRKDDNDLPSI